MKFRGQRRIRVLIVDDSTIICERLQMFLRDSSEVQIVGVAATAAEALRLFALRRPEVVLLDLNLPDQSGLEVLRHCKQQDPTCAVIVLTNSSQREHFDACFRLGADFFFDKARHFEAALEVVGSLPRSTSAKNALETNGDSDAGNSSAYLHRWTPKPCTH